LAALEIADGKISDHQWLQLTKKLKFEFSGDIALRFKSAVPHLRMIHLRIGSNGARVSQANNSMAEQLEDLKLKLAEQELAVTELSARLSSTQYDLDFQALELEEASKEISRLEGARAYLKNLLAEMKIFGVNENSASAGIWDIEPNSFEEILEAVQLTETLRFTGKFSYVAQLDGQPNIGAGLSRAWNGLRALDAYVSMKRLGQFQGGFFDYLLDETHPGFKVPNSYFAAKESESVKVNPSLHEARVFRVPEEVRDGGSAFMEAHLKVMVNNALAPRMHFLDDTSNTGFVWIGYLGPHLPL